MHDSPVVHRRACSAVARVSSFGKGVVPGLEFGLANVEAPLEKQKWPSLQPASRSACQGRKHEPSNNKATMEELPPTLTLWFCVGRGSKGNFADCTGDCSTERIDVVPAETFADLFEAKTVVVEQPAIVAKSLHQFSELVAPGGATEEFWSGTRDKARDVLSALEGTSSRMQSIAFDREQAAEVWRCSTCGSVEATSPGIGVCLRKTVDFVSLETCELQAKDVADLSEAVDAAIMMFRLLRGVAPRDGKWELCAKHFQTAVSDLLMSHRSLKFPNAHSEPA